MKESKEIDLDEISSIHILPSGKAIAKYPLGVKDNISFKVNPELIDIINNSGQWRIVKTDGTVHAIKNPDGKLDFDIPKDLDLSGKSIIFGDVGAGKSTLLSFIGRDAVSKNMNVFTIESPRSLCIDDATHLDNDDRCVDTVLLCRPDLVLFDEVRDRKHYNQLKQLALACPKIIGSFHAVEIFEALARFSNLNGHRSYGELSTISDRFIHVEKGKIVNWYSLRTTLSSRLSGEFYCDGERPVTEIRDRNDKTVGWIFYFANDINIVKKHEHSDNDKKLIAGDHQHIPATPIIEKHTITKYKAHMTDDEVIEHSVKHVERCVTITVKEFMEGETVDVYSGDDYLFSTTIGKKGVVKISKDTDAARRIMEHPSIVALKRDTELRLY